MLLIATAKLLMGLVAFFRLLEMETILLTHFAFQLKDCQRSQENEKPWTSEIKYAMTEYCWACVIYSSDYPVPQLYLN